MKKFYKKHNENLKENKTIAFNPQGEQISEYLKHGRSIGELCQKGDGELKSFDTEYGKIAPFICSDMAFSSKIRQAGKNNVDMLLVPASDWREMTLPATNLGCTGRHEWTFYLLFAYGKFICISMRHICLRKLYNTKMAKFINTVNKLFPVYGTEELEAV